MVEIICDGVYCSGLLVASFLLVERTSGKKAIGGSSVFLNQPFLKIDIVWTSVCVSVCVHPRAIKNYSRDMKSE